MTDRKDASIEDMAASYADSKVEYLVPDNDRITEQVLGTGVEQQQLIDDAVSNTREHKILIHDAAKLYATLGFRVVPLQRPTGTTGKGFASKHVNPSSSSSNVKTINKWFHPDTGKYAGHNVGIIVGKFGESGFTVMDLDCHRDGQDGLADFRKLIKKYGKPPPHPVVRTPNGLHGYFQYCSQFERAKTTVPEYPGIEIFSGNNSRMMVLPPSVVKDRAGDWKQYKWKVHPKNVLMPPVPDWLIEVFQPDGPVVNGQQPGRGGENVTADDLEQVVPLPQVGRMLAAIDPDDLSYDDWLKVGQAIHSQHQDKDGLKVWDEWSRTGERYKPDECCKRWPGFNATGSVRIGTLYWFAMQYGWQPEPSDVRGDPVSLKVAELNQTYAYLAIGGKERMLRERLPASDSDLHFDLLNRQAFTGLLAALTVAVEINGETKIVKLATAWLNHPHRRTYPNGVGLFPPGSTAPPGTFNTWNGFAVEPAEGDCLLFLAHVRNVICRGDNDLYEWLLDWLADLVQDPANPKGCAVVMRGKEGTGKGTLANTVGELFGPHYVHLIDEKHLTGNFNAHMMEALVVFADEITWGGNVKSAGKLKGLVTESKLVGERKGIDHENYHNRAHLIIASNSDWVVPAGASSRRWAVFDVDDSTANQRDYFGPIYAELKNGGREALLWFLQHRKYDPDKLRLAPETEALYEQRELSSGSRNKFSEWLHYWLDEGELPVAFVFEHPEHGRCVDKKALHGNYKEYCRELGGQPINDSVFGKRLLKVFPDAKHGQSEWPRVSFEGSRVRVVPLADRNKMVDQFVSYSGTSRGEFDRPEEDWREVRS